MPGTTPVYGFPYPEPTDLVADYPALGQDLAEDIEAVLPTLGGYTLISPTSIANTGGTASTTAGTTTITGVTNVSLNGVFTATYQNYHLVLNYTGSAAGQILARLRVAGADASGGNYNTQRAYFYSTTSNPARFNNETFYRIGSADANVSQCLMTTTIASPFLTQATVVLSQEFSNGDSNNTQLGYWGGYHTLSTSYDGITVWNNGGTLTGKLRVYGLKGA